MRAFRTLLPLIGLAMAGMMTLTAQAKEKDDEQKVSLNKVPPAVKAAIVKAAKGAKIKEIERET